MPAYRLLSESLGLGDWYSRKCFASSIRAFARLLLQNHTTAIYTNKKASCSIRKSSDNRSGAAQVNAKCSNGTLVVFSAKCKWYKRGTSATPAGTAQLLSTSVARGSTEDDFFAKHVAQCLTRFYIRSRFLSIYAFVSEPCSRKKQGNITNQSIHL